MNEMGLHLSSPNRMHRNFGHFRSQVSSIFLFTCVRVDRCNREKVQHTKKKEIISNSEWAFGVFDVWKCACANQRFSCIYRYSLSPSLAGWLLPSTTLSTNLHTSCYLLIPDFCLFISSLLTLFFLYNSICRMFVNFRSIHSNQTNMAAKRKAKFNIFACLQWFFFLSKNKYANRIDKRKAATKLEFWLHWIEEKCGKYKLEGNRMVHLHSEPLSHLLY